MIPKSQESGNSLKCYSFLNLRGTFLADTLYSHKLGYHVDVKTVGIVESYQNVVKDTVSYLDSMV